MLWKFKIQKAETEEERERLRADLVRQELERKRASERKRALAAKLKGMEAKLLKGGQMLDKAARQEAELRDAQQTLQEKEQHERLLAQELALQEEAKEDITEKYGCIEEEVEKKSRKLEKLVKKLADTESELGDLQGEFQREREDMLDTIRQLARQIKLKEVIVDLFVPLERVQQLEQQIRRRSREKMRRIFRNLSCGLGKKVQRRKTLEECVLGSLSLSRERERCVTPWRVFWRVAKGSDVYSSTRWEDSLEYQRAPFSQKRLECDFGERELNISCERTLYLRRTVWNEEKDTWSLRPLAMERAAPRPLSKPFLRRPETEYARHRKQYDPNPRYKYDNIAVLELDPSERTTQDYDGPQMHSNIQVILETSIDQQDPEVQPSSIEQPSRGTAQTAHQQQPTVPSPQCE